MRTSNINVRVEPEIARGLTWITNKYNYEHNKAYTKTDIIELIIKAALSPEPIIEYAERICASDKGYCENFVAYMEANYKNELKGD